MTDLLHSHNSNHSGLRSGRHRSLLAKMPTPKPRKKLRPRGPAGVKRSASRGRGKKWTLILLVVLLLIPAMQVAVVRFINPPLTLPMLIDQGRSWIRKGLESYYTIWMEALLPKRRILELYANVIEMGRGIYGVEAASQHYFGVSARGLTREQSAMLAAVLPNPKGWDPTKPGR